MKRIFSSIGITSQSDQIKKLQKDLDALQLQVEN